MTTKFLLEQMHHSQFPMLQGDSLVSDVTIYCYNYCNKIASQFTRQFGRKSVAARIAQPESYQRSNYEGGGSKFQIFGMAKIQPGHYIRANKMTHVV